MFSIKISTISLSFPIKNTDFPFRGIEALKYYYIYIRNDCVPLKGNNCQFAVGILASKGIVNFKTLPLPNAFSAY